MAHFLVLAVLELMALQALGAVVSRPFGHSDFAMWVMAAQAGELAATGFVAFALAESVGVMVDLKSFAALSFCAVFEEGDKFLERVTRSMGKDGLVESTGHHAADANLWLQVAGHA